MSLLSNLGGSFQKFAAGEGSPEQHFNQVAQSVPCSSLASGSAVAFKSNETAPFAQMASLMFSNGSAALGIAMKKIAENHAA